MPTKPIYCKISLCIPFWWKAYVWGCAFYAWARGKEFDAAAAAHFIVEHARIETAVEM